MKNYVTVIKKESSLERLKKKFLLLFNPMIDTDEIEDYEKENIVFYNDDGSVDERKTLTYEFMHLTKKIQNIEQVLQVCSIPQYGALEDGISMYKKLRLETYRKIRELDGKAVCTKRIVYSHGFLHIFEGTNVTGGEIKRSIPLTSAV